METYIIFLFRYEINLSLEPKLANITNCFKTNKKKER